MLPPTLVEVLARQQSLGATMRLGATCHDLRAEVCRLMDVAALSSQQTFDTYRCLECGARRDDVDLRKVNNICPRCRQSLLRTVRTCERHEWYSVDTRVCEACASDAEGYRQMLFLPAACDYARAACGAHWLPKNFFGMLLDASRRSPHHSREPKTGRHRFDRTLVRQVVDALDDGDA